jgi:hypothetical protein
MSNSKHILSLLHQYEALRSISLLGVFTLLFSTSGFSQAQVSRESSEIISIKEYEPILSDAFKIKNNPAINDTNKLIPQLKYSFLDKQIPVNFEIEPIQSARIKGEPLKKLYRGYAKAGIGTNATPLMELYYNSKRSKTLSYGFSGKHFSSNGIANRDYSGFSDNQLSAFGKHFSKDFTTYAKVGYTRNVNHYYGFSEANAELVKDANAVKQELGKFDVAFSLTRNFTDTTQFDYYADLAFHTLKDKSGVSENHFEAKGKLSKYHKKELYSIGVDVNYNKLINGLNQDNNLIVGINPQISTSTDKWQFKIGVGLYLNSYPNTKFHFYPKAEFKYNVVENIIIPYVGIKGGLVGNNLNNFYKENPFINTQTLATQNSNQQYDIYGGIRGSLSSKITFNTSFSQQKIEGIPLYVKDLSTGLDNQFTLVYDTASVSTITGELTYQKLEKFKVLLGGQYFNYNLSNELKAWHKPALKISLSGIYDLSDKIVVRADFFYFSKQYAQVFNNTTTNSVTAITEVGKELDGVFDLNLNVEYRYTKKLSAFIQFNNIISTPYQRWQDYPTQRFGVLGGLTYSF